MYVQPKDNDRLPTEIVFNRCVEFNRIHAPVDIKTTDEYRYKAMVHSRVQVAINNGTLIRQPCSVCGSINNIEAHHKDYSKALDVVWLCRDCHETLHTYDK